MVGRSQVTSTLVGLAQDQHASMPLNPQEPVSYVSFWSHVQLEASVSQTCSQMRLSSGL